MDLLVENNVPGIMVYGDCDDIVPYEENGALLERCYSRSGGIIEVISKKIADTILMDWKTAP